MNLIIGRRGSAIHPGAHAPGFLAFCGKPRYLHAFRSADRKDAAVDRIDEMEAKGWELAAMDAHYDDWDLVFKRRLA